MVLCALVAGVLSAPAVAAPPPVTGVVAVVDTGINPYHSAFRDRSPLAQRYPGDYLPGFPRGVPALRLTLDAPDLTTALAKDCALWRTVQPGRLYWFPGTKVVGAISFRPDGTGLCEGLDSTPILDTNGHGTMAASRAVGNGYGACPECRLVAVQAVRGAVAVRDLGLDGEAARQGVEWVAQQAAWVDAQSNSWSPPAPHDPTGTSGILAGNPALTRTVEDAAQRQLVAFASGNGLGSQSLPPPRPTLGWSHATPSVLLVGGHDSGRVLEWPNQPVHLVGDACDNPAADARTTTSSPPDHGGGTSAATPWVAGGAVRELVVARRLLGARGTGVRDGVVARGRALAAGPLQDGRLTLAEWRRVLLATASARPVAEPSDGPACPRTVGPQWSTVPDGAPEAVAVGYGAVDSRAQRLAADVLAGRAPLPERPTADALLSARDAASAALHQLYARG
jgi:hypothetical protein